MSSEKNTTPVVATKRINGDIEPGTIICPDTVAELEELRELKAVDDCSEADLALYEQQQKSVKSPTKAEKAAAEKAAAEKAEAEAAEKAAAEAAARGSPSSVIG